MADRRDGRRRGRTGRWKIFLIIGGVFLTAGSVLMGLLRADTDYWLASIYMFLTGVGIGMTMQELGTASSVVVFFRTLGGTAGVAALGAVLSNRVAQYTADGLAELGVHNAADDGSIPKLSSLPAPIRAVVETAFGHGVGDVFLYGSPLALLVLARQGGVELPPPGVWTIDSAHSKVAATAQHLGLSSVQGRFTEFSGRIDVGATAEASGVAVEIAAASINTGNDTPGYPSDA
ncbi:MFS family permease [Streptosporangium album]|uniref:MFS family permease n=1 Tax=Streptosporangium album TaxID=47479 RepID=A0A7W7RVJ2_9ACTN|nr:YceI family protein [Streptosporangium album]MBB4938722.1 MFS family permease [Streptosporangium album]